MSISSLCKLGTPNVNSAVPPRPIGPDAPVPRLLYVASTKSQGGIERHSVDLAEALQMRGASVRFACNPAGFVEQWCRKIGVPTSAFLVRNSGDLQAALRLAHLIHAERIDIVHVHSRRDYVVGVLGVALARRRIGRRVGLILHAHMVRPLGEPTRLAGRFFEWGADAVAAVSSTVSDHLRYEHQFNPAFIHLIPNGIHLDRFAFPGSPEAARQCAGVRNELRIPKDALILGMIGRLDAKGQRQLLAVLPRLLAHCPSLRVVLIGTEGEPGEKAALTEMAQRNGFEDRLIFTGPRSDIPEMLPALDVLVHLPTDEAFGLALAEGMAAGLPAVATAIGGCREIVRDGITGLLVPPGDLDALTEALLWLLDAEQGNMRRSKMGGAGYELVRNNFSRQLQVERLLALYRGVCAAI